MEPIKFAMFTRGAKKVRKLFHKVYKVSTNSHTGFAQEDNDPILLRITRTH